MMRTGAIKKLRRKKPGPGYLICAQYWFFTFCLCLEVTPLFGSNTKVVSNYFGGKKSKPFIPLGKGEHIQTILDFNFNHG